jgi:hypothetical protein
LGRALAAQYEEIVIDRLYPGNIYLIRALQPLIQDLEVTLALDEHIRERTLPFTLFLRVPGSLCALDLQTLRALACHHERNSPFVSNCRRLYRAAKK